MDRKKGEGNSGMLWLKVVLMGLVVIIVGLAIAVVMVVNRKSVEVVEDSATEVEVVEQYTDLPDDIREVMMNYQEILNAQADTKEKGETYVARAYKLRKYMLEHEGVDLCEYIMKDVDEANRLAGEDVAEDTAFVSSVCVGDNYSKKDGFTYTIVLEDK